MSASYSLPAVSYDLTGAAASAGVSTTTIKEAIADGSLTAHYAGPKATKPVIRALDLDEWVRSLPTQRRAS